MKETSNIFAEELIAKTERDLYEDGGTKIKRQTTSQQDIDKIKSFLQLINPENNKSEVDEYAEVTFLSDPGIPFFPKEDFTKYPFLGTINVKDDHPNDPTDEMYGGVV
jgi:hypothetical protein